MAADYTGALKLLYDWQTLLTGLLALLAAIIAARPAWRQIRSLQIQSAVMARDTLIMRVAALESQRDTTRTRITSITSEFVRRIYPYEGETEPDLNPEWAAQAEQTVNQVVTALTALQETSLDGELIDTMRRATIQQAKELSTCLSDIWMPYSGVLDDPELNLTKEEVAAAEAAATAAEGNLEQRISAVEKGGAALDAAFQAGLERLRDRIRQIDALIVR